MTDLKNSEKLALAILQARLGRVERGEMWGHDRPGPYTAEEKTEEVARIKARIAELARRELQPQ